MRQPKKIRNEDANPVREILMIMKMMMMMNMKKMVLIMKEFNLPKRRVQDVQQKFQIFKLPSPPHFHSRTQRKHLY
jgi:hypothetical protein